MLQGFRGWLFSTKSSPLSGSGLPIGPLGRACLATFVVLFVGLNVVLGLPMDELSDYVRALATLLFGIYAVKSWTTYARSRRSTFDR